jgi:hypothetical protein
MIAVGNEVFTDAGEEIVELVAAIAVNRLGVEIKLDQVEDDVLVLAPDLLEEAAENRSADFVIGAEKLSRCPIERQLAESDRRCGVVDPRCVQNHARGFDAIVRALKINFVGRGRRNQVLENT